MNKKILLFILLGSIIFIICIIMATLYFTTDILKSNETLFWKYFSRVSEIKDLIIDDKLIIQEKFKNDNSYISDGDIELNIVQGENSTKKLNLKTSSRYNINSKRTYSSLSLMNGDLGIFDISYINSGDIYAIKCDEVTQNYIGIRNLNLHELLKNYGIDSNIPISNSIKLNEYIESFNIDEQTKEYINKKYGTSILNNISENKYISYKEEIDINGIIHTTNTYELRTTLNNVKKIILEILKNAKSDDVLLLLISQKLEALSLSENYTNIENLKLNLENIIENINKLELENDISIRVYEERGKTIRINAEIPNLCSIIFDNSNENKSLTIDIYNNKENILNIDNRLNNEIIDLNKYEESQNNIENIITRVKIEKEIANNNNIMKIKIIPNLNREEISANIQITISDIQNNSFSNSILLSANIISNEKTKSILISYKNNLTKTNQGEEVMELTDANTVIANNYSKSEFVPYITKWNEIFINKLNEKLKILGFENM